MAEDEKLLEALEQVRRDKHQPFRYVLFTFFNGIAYGLGMGLGMTLVLGLAVFILAQVIAHMVNIPVVGQYFSEIKNLLEIYSKQGGRIR